MKSKWFTMWVVLIHDNKDIGLIYYWSLVHYCPYFMALLYKKYYELIGIECVLRSSTTANYQLNRKL